MLLSARSVGAIGAEAAMSSAAPDVAGLCCQPTYVSIRADRVTSGLQTWQRKHKVRGDNRGKAFSSVRSVLREGLKNKTPSFLYFLSSLLSDLNLIKTI